ncbi:MAG TPA: ADP-ribosylglycohydrolase family protein, partial [Tepidisphaeraceae bacterium]|nr:ADP-ribosylglycohydrolase family protein [Tepidisphaeraceae bacterium]
SVIPRRSRFHETVVHTIATCDRFDRRFDQFEAVHDAILEPLKSYNWVHVLPNAAIVVSALLLGGGDYERTISAAVMAGYDTDCNGATAGSTCGAMIGAEALPRRWTDPLNDTLYSAIPGYHPISIRECARRSLAITQTS